MGIGNNGTHNLNGTKLVSDTLCPESGTLSSNTTWTTGANCVYEIESLEIPSGKTLTIDPGVIVKTNSGSIEVDSGGTLDVSGSSGSPVSFTSMNDNSIGLDTGSGSPAAGDYNEAIDMNGGTLDVSHASFEYATSAIGDELGTSSADVTVTDSSFSNDTMGVSLGSSTVDLSLQRNSFDLSAGIYSWDNAITVSNDADLTGIVLNGSNKNTFTGSGVVATVAVMTSTVPSDETWEISSGSGAILESTANGSGVPGVTVDGTLNIDSGGELLAPDNSNYSDVEVDGTMNISDGVVVKGLSSNPIQVDPGGTLDATGTSENPITFTSMNDNTVGGDTGSGSPAVSDYNAAVAMHGGTTDISYADFEYATYGVGGVGSDSSTTVTVTDSSFTNDYVGVDLPYASSLSLDLERNAFDVTATGFNNSDISVKNDSDLSKIYLTGDNENTFTGSTPGMTVYVAQLSDVPSEATWAIPSGVVIGSAGDPYSGSGITVDGTMELDSGAELLTSGNTGGFSVSVNGTMTIDSGVIIKSTNVTPFQVNSDGSLNVTGTSGSPVTFTSMNDNGVGGDPAAVVRQSMITTRRST